MNRVEFIDTLRMILEKELPRDKVDENVKYYDEYLKSMGDEQTQSEEIDKIGGPHLIAQTIIESYKISGQYRYAGSSGQNYYEQPEREENTVNRASGVKNETGSFWGSVKSVCITVGIIIVLIFLFRFAFNIFIRIGLPLLACYLLIKLVTGFFNK